MAILCVAVVDWWCTGVTIAETGITVVGNRLFALTLQQHPYSAKHIYFSKQIVLYLTKWGKMQQGHHFYGNSVSITE